MVFPFFEHEYGALNTTNLPAIITTTVDYTAIPNQLISNGANNEHWVVILILVIVIIML